MVDTVPEGQMPPCFAANVEAVRLGEPGGIAVSTGAAGGSVRAPRAGYGVVSSSRRPASWTSRAIWTRLLRPSLARMRETWVFTVGRLM